VNRFRLGLIILIALIFGVSLVTYAVTYTVQFSEAAVVTSFGKVSAVRDEPGLGFKAPYPIGGVTKYDRRNRILTTTVETVQTADDNPVVVEAFCIWNISDASSFFARFSNAGPRAEDHYDMAQETLESRVRNAMSHVSSFRLEDLFTADVQRSRLGALEERLLAAVTAGSDEGGGIASDGLQVSIVGISSIELPESVTERVFERMRAERAQLVRTLESDAESRARSIRARATSDAEKIRSFANSLAAEIEAKGELESADYLHQMAANTDLAVFLANLEFLRTAYAKRATLVLSTATPGFMLMNPDLWQAASASEPVPGVQWDGRVAASEHESRREAGGRGRDDESAEEPAVGGGR
jgi:membrane protease subunit HflC